MSEPAVVGNTHEWLLNAYVNSESAPDTYAPWDLTGGTVTITFVSPSGHASHFSATLLSDTGKVSYTNLAGLFSVAGSWGMSWHIVLGPISMETEIGHFVVYPSGAQQ